MLYFWFVVITDNGVSVQLKPHLLCNQGNVNSVMLKISQQPQRTLWVELGGGGGEVIDNKDMYALLFHVLFVHRIIVNHSHWLNLKKEIEVEYKIQKKFDDSKEKAELSSFCQKEW